MKKDDYVKIVAVDGNYRYGYIDEIRDRAFILVISLFDEGESKIAYDAASDAIVGQEPTDYISLLTEAEKRIVPLLSIGYNTNDIATTLSTSPKTVRAQLRTLRIKLHLDTRAQLIAFSRGLDNILRRPACQQNI
ncbi:unnamed protein product [marine sediment metagenome]|uniref:HTH luxR-type domain-containing protein n=1 Tax=marine sediment metagenome TaxID=412755 RepID=X1C213_9ZZZZ